VIHTVVWTVKENEIINNLTPIFAKIDSLSPEERETVFIAVMTMMNRYFTEYGKRDQDKEREFTWVI
jgi:septin family protein